MAALHPAGKRRKANEAKPFECYRRAALLVTVLLAAPPAQADTYLHIVPCHGRVRYCDVVWHCDGDAEWDFRQFRGGAVGLE